MECECGVKKVDSGVSDMRRVTVCVVLCTLLPIGEYIQQIQQKDYFSKIIFKHLKVFKTRSLGIYHNLFYIVNCKSIILFMQL